MAENYNKGLIPGSLKTVQTLMLPYLGLAAIDAIDSNESDFKKKLIGAGGLKSWAPVDSVSSLAESGRGLLSSPVGQVGGELYKALKEQDAEKINRTVQRGMATFMPGAGLMKLLGEDIPVLIKGKPAPTGPVMERRIEQISKLLD